MTDDELIAELLRVVEPGDSPGSHGSYNLPALHRALAAKRDGIEAYAGYFRLFAHTASRLAWWNDPETWKFAWNGRADDYLCFGETAWGDQYAYKFSDLESGREPAIYCLDAFCMEAEPMHDNFRDFLEREFLRNAQAPYDEMVVAARERFGALTPDEHLIYQPSLLLGGDERVASLEKMSAVAAMIVNGDLHAQLGEETFDRPVLELLPVQDPRGRTRLKVIWGR